MSPVDALREGLGCVNRVKRMWAVYWLWNTAFALVVVLPVSAVLFRDLGHSLYAGRMFENFEVQWLIEFYQQTHLWPAIVLAPVAVLAAGGFLLAGTFLAGGALWTFRDPSPRFVPAVFYQGCGRNFARLVWLLLLSLPFYAAVLLIGGSLNALASKVWGEGLEAHPLVIFGWFRLALVALLALAVNMVFDYAKIRMVAEDLRNPWRALAGSAALVARNFGPAAGTFALVAAIGLALSAAYLLLSNLLPRGAMGWLALALLLQQACIVGRIWVRLTFYAGQTRMYEALTAPPREPAGLSGYTG
jgi:hypothetical protein